MLAQAAILTYLDSVTIFLPNCPLYLFYWSPIIAAEKKVFLWLLLMAKCELITTPNNAQITRILNRFGLPRFSLFTMLQWLPRPISVPQTCQASSSLSRNCDLVSLWGWRCVVGELPVAIKDRIFVLRVPPVAIKDRRCVLRELLVTHVFREAFTNSLLVSLHCFLVMGASVWWKNVKEEGFVLAHNEEAMRWMQVLGSFTVFSSPWLYGIP